MLNLSLLNGNLSIRMFTTPDCSCVSGAERTITAEACGFQFLLFFPLEINTRAQRAYQALEAEAAGDFITDVQVRERWTYGFVGTQYCTALRAKAIRPKSS